MDECVESLTCFGCSMGKLLSKSKTKVIKNSRESRYAVPDDAVMFDSQEAIKRYAPVHTDAVTCVGAMGTGMCLSGSKDQTVSVFDFHSGALMAKWTGHEREVTKVVYGRVVQCSFSASRDKLVHMWQQGHTDPVITFRGHDLVVTGLALNTDNSQLCTGSRDNSLRLWSVETAQCLNQNTISRNLITHVCWSPTTNTIAQTGEDKEVKIWDARTLQVSQSFPRKQHIQTWCDISGDGNYCITSSNGFQGNGCEATLWDLRTTRLVHEFKGHNETICSCVFIPPSLTGSRNLLATSSNDCSVRIWDQDTASCVACTDIPASGPLTSIAVFDQSESVLCVSSFNTGIHILQLTLNPDSTVKLSRTVQF